MRTVVVFVIGFVLGVILGRGLPWDGPEVTMPPLPNVEDDTDWLREFRIAKQPITSRPMLLRENA